MAKKIVLLSIALCAYSCVVFAQNSVPSYVTEFTQKSLKDFIKPIENHVSFAVGDQEGLLKKVEMRISTLPRGTKGSQVYSTYTFRFIDASQPSTFVPEVEVHRMFDKKGEYLSPEIVGEIDILIKDGKILNGERLQGRLRSLFRSDSTVHPLFENPIKGASPKKLSTPQMEALGGKTTDGFKQPGLVDFYKNHVADSPTQPMHGAIILPTGIGKTILALKYIEFVAAMNAGVKPFLVFVVQNKQILDDVAQKFQEFFPNEKVARLYGSGTKNILTGEVQAILATRTTYKKRMGEIHDFLKTRQAPVVMYRDEAHHTGKNGGEFEAILKDFLRTQNSRAQVIDLTATAWHEDNPRLLRQYEGRVATSFLEPHEYRNLIAGEQIPIIARIQLLRAIFSGWLSPLNQISFITKNENGNGDKRSFRTRLLQEQKDLAAEMKLPVQDFLKMSFDQLSDNQVGQLREYINKLHAPIAQAVYDDIIKQQVWSSKGQVAEFDRGLIFVPTILHAEIYQRILGQLSEGKPMDFRVIHSKMHSGGKYDTVGENVDWLNDLDRSNKARHKYLINVAMAREGVDIPGVNRISFVTASDSIKVLLQAFGRATRLRPLKSGIRLTDFGGSYLKFFNEIPAELLERIFPQPKVQGELDSSRTEKRTVPRSIQLDGQAIDVKNLVGIQLESPMEELSRIEGQDAEKVVEVVEEKVAEPERNEKTSEERELPFKKSIAELEALRLDQLSKGTYFAIAVNEYLHGQTDGDPKESEWARYWDQVELDTMKKTSKLTGVKSIPSLIAMGASLYGSSGIELGVDVFELREWLFKPVPSKEVQNLIGLFRGEVVGEKVRNFNLLPFYFMNKAGYSFREINGFGPQKSTDLVEIIRSFEKNNYAEINWLNNIRLSKEFERLSISESRSFMNQFYGTPTKKPFSLGGRFAMYTYPDERSKGASYQENIKRIFPNNETLLRWGQIKGMMLGFHFLELANSYTDKEAFGEISEDERRFLKEHKSFLMELPTEFKVADEGRGLNANELRQFERVNLSSETFKALATGERLYLKGDGQEVSQAEKDFVKAWYETFKYEIGDSFLSRNNIPTLVAFAERGLQEIRSKNIPSTVIENHKWLANPVDPEIAEMIQQKRALKQIFSSKLYNYSTVGIINADILPLVAMHEKGVPLYVVRNMGRKADNQMKELIHEFLERNKSEMEKINLSELFEIRESFIDDALRAKSWDPFQTTVYGHEEDKDKKRESLVRLMYRNMFQGFFEPLNMDVAGQPQTEELFQKWGRIRLFLIGKNLDQQIRNKWGTNLNESLRSSQAGVRLRAYFEANGYDGLEKNAETRSASKTNLTQNFLKGEFSIVQYEGMMARKFAWSLNNLYPYSQERVDRALEKIADFHSFSNREVRSSFVHFEYWRQLSMPWQIFLQDAILTHPIERDRKNFQWVDLENFMETDRYSESFKANDQKRVIDAFLAGNLEALPEPYKKFYETVSKVPGGMDRVEALMIFESLISQPKGRKLLVQSPHIIRALNSYDVIFNERARWQADLQQDSRTYLRDPRFAQATNRSERWIRADRFKDSRDRDLYRKSLQNHLPFIPGVYDAVDKGRGRVSPLRVMAVAKQLGLRSNLSQSLYADFMEPKLMTDKSIPGVKSGVGMSEFTYQWKTGAESHAETTLDFGRRRESSSFLRVEKGLWLQNLYLEVLNKFGEAELSRQASSLIGEKSKVSASTLSMHRGEFLPPIHNEYINQEFIKQNKKAIAGKDLSPDKVQWALEVFRQGYAMPEQLLPWGDPEIVRATQWADLWYKVHFTQNAEQTSKVSRNSQKDLKRIMAKALLNSADFLPDYVLEARDLLMIDMESFIKAVDKFDWTTRVSKQWVFKNRRFFMFLPDYIMYKYGYDITVVDGFGKGRASDIEKIFRAFDERFGEEVKRSGLIDFFDPSQESTSEAREKMEKGDYRIRTNLAFSPDRDRHEARLSNLKDALEVTKVDKSYSNNSKPYEIQEMSESRTHYLRMVSWLMGEELIDRYGGNNGGSPRSGGGPKGSGGGLRCSQIFK